jgi:hypothetical protein
MHFSTEKLLGVTFEYDVTEPGIIRFEDDSVAIPGFTITSLKVGDTTIQMSDLDDESWADIVCRIMVDYEDTEGYLLENTQRVESYYMDLPVEVEYAISGEFKDATWYDPPETPDVDILKVTIYGKEVRLSNTAVNELADEILGEYDSERRRR